MLKETDKRMLTNNSIVLLIKRTINYTMRCEQNVHTAITGLRIQGNKRREEDIQLDL